MFAAILATLALTLGGRRNLWSDGLPGEPARERDRRPGGAGRESGRCSVLGNRARTVPHVLWTGTGRCRSRSLVCATALDARAAWILRLFNGVPF
jgi:hypothetical protein